MKRWATGIPELDLVLGGGLPGGSLVVVAGGPGTGKTILAQQISFANATPERKAIYYTTLSEPPSKLVRHLEPFDFFDTTALEECVEVVTLESLLFDESSHDGDPLAPTVAEIIRSCFERRPSVVVVDSARALHDFADPQAVRRMFYQLSGRVGHTDTVLLLLGEYRADELQSVEFSIADGIVELANEPHEPVDRRWLRVLKLRGARHLGGKHSVEIGPTGIAISPRLESLRPPAEAALDGGRIRSGIAGLDEMMGGGIPKGDVTAILGPAGSGKTAAALRFIAEGIKEGERCLYVSFQEATDQLIRKAASFGWDLAGPRESGRLIVHDIPHGNLDLDVLAAVVRATIADGSVRRVAIDSLAELVYAARESERFPAYARTLAGFLRSNGATSLITSETATLGPMTVPLGGLSFLFHNVVLLRFIEQDSQLRRAVIVLKMRDSDHEKGVRQYEITGDGVVVGDRFEAVTGVLGWTALREDPPPRT
jgi:circadian clock protein KaiC